MQSRLFIFGLIRIDDPLEYFMAYVSYYSHSVDGQFGHIPVKIEVTESVFNELSELDSFPIEVNCFLKFVHIEHNKTSLLLTDLQRPFKG